MKVKKKKEFGWFSTLNPGNPEINKDIFNHNMETGDMPQGTPSGPVAEDLTEAQKKNEYEIRYLTRDDDTVKTSYISAYSEGQAALLFRKKNNNIYRIVSIVCIEDHSKDDGEQLSLFEDKFSYSSVGKFPSGLVTLIKKAAKDQEEYKRTKIDANKILDFLYKGKTEGYQIHHLNLDATDNRFENLVYIPESMHAALHGAEVWGRVIYALAKKNNIDASNLDNKELLVELILNAEKEELLKEYLKQSIKYLSQHGDKVIYLNRIG